MAKGAGARDMTEGSPMKLIWGFFVPMVFGLLFQQLYNMADTIIVGRCLEYFREFFFLGHTVSRSSHGLTKLYIIHIII